MTEIRTTPTGSKYPALAWRAVLYLDGRVCSSGAYGATAEDARARLVARDAVTARVAAGLRLDNKEA